LHEAGSSIQKQTFTRHFVFAGDVDGVPAARDTVMEFLAEHVVGDDEEIDLLVALQEAFANAALHGCGGNPAKKFECDVELDASEIRIAVRDPGDGFDTSLTDASEDGTNLSHHGRGILLMRSLMDEITYRRGGSELHMKKVRRSGE
jgi:anti-sigma regulatory factor (Ser/Thr protein kinase)